MYYKYCEKCGCVFKSRYITNECLNVLCDNTVYDLDESMVELITFLHKEGIVTKMCCGGHIGNEKGLFINFELDSLAHIEDVLKVLNAECSEHYKFICTNTHGDGNKRSPSITFKYNNDSNSLDYKGIRELLYLQLEAYDVFKNDIIINTLFNLTSDDIKERYILFNRNKRGD